MDNFSHYFKQSLSESKFREIDSSLISKIYKIVQTYNAVYKKVDSTTKLLLKNVKDDPKLAAYFEGEGITKIANLSSLKFVDLATKKAVKANIIIAYGGSETSFAFYDDSNNLMVIYQDNVKHLSDIELGSVIYHELTHGMQEYKDSSEEYKNALNKIAKGKPFKPHVYFLEPIEFDAHLTELAFRIKEEYNKKKTNIEKTIIPESKKLLERKLEKFLLEWRLFIKADAPSYMQYKELSLPQFFSTHIEFLQAISKSKYHWKKLKEKLAALYVDLVGDHP
jgi:hypothetical protein